MLDSATKDAALLAIADALERARRRSSRPTSATSRPGREAGLSAALMDRLALDAGRIAAMARGVREIVALPDPVGEVIDGSPLRRTAC